MERLFLFQKDQILMKGHRVSGAKFGALAQFRLSVELNQTTFYYGFGLPAAFGKIHGLEQLYQLNVFSTNGKAEFFTHQFRLW